MPEVLRSITLLLVLLNPFLIIIYLVDLLERLEKAVFVSVMLRAGIIASVVFCCFAVLGDAIFSSMFQTQFASFQIFGGVIFLLIGLQFVFRGPTAIEVLRGESEYLAGAIAMPILIGPGTISASVLIGKRHEPITACAAVVTAVMLSLALILVLKSIHDFVKPRRAKLIERYIEVAGRIAALYVGTVAIDMVMQGVRSWVKMF